MVPSSVAMQRLEKEFSQEWEIYTVVTHETRLATLHELDTVYTTVDLYDMIEIIEAHSTVLEEQHKMMEHSRTNNK